MTITVDLRPDVQAELARQAASQGCPVEAYAASLIEEAVHHPDIGLHPSQGKSLREMFESVQGLADDVDFSRDPSAGPPVDLS